MTNTEPDNRLSDTPGAYGPPYPTCDKWYLLSALYSRIWTLRNQNYHRPARLIGTGSRSQYTWINRVLAWGLRHRLMGYEAIYAAALNLLAPTAEPDATTGRDGETVLGNKWVWRFRILQDNGRADLAAALLDAGLKYSAVFDRCHETMEAAWQAFISAFEGLSDEHRCQLLAGDIIDHSE